MSPTGPPCRLSRRKRRPEKRCCPLTISDQSERWKLTEYFDASLSMFVGVGLFRDVRAGRLGDTLRLLWGIAGVDLPSASLISPSSSSPAAERSAFSFQDGRGGSCVRGFGGTLDCSGGSSS